MIETPIFAEPALTADHIARASSHLCVSRDLLVASVSGLSDAQWHFKPAPESWSVLEILEHLVLIEARVHAIIRNLASAPEAEAGARQVEQDEVILSQVPQRTTRVKAPEPVSPANRWSPSEALQQFLANREQTIECLGAPLLRGRVRPHPIFGPWDGYQWLLATAAHTSRHTDQIRELQADQNYPH